MFYSPFQSSSNLFELLVFDQGPDDDMNMDKLDTYFEAPRILYHANPVQWWYARKAEYPRLYRFARDIMSIPGTV
jgi:hypothetical protein